MLMEVTQTALTKHSGRTFCQSFMSVDLESIFIEYITTMLYLFLL